MNTFVQYAMIRGHTRPSAVLVDLWFCVFAACLFPLPTNMILLIVMRRDREPNTRVDGVKTDKIHVLETRYEASHKEVIEELEKCLAIARDNPSIHTVVICMEDRQKNVEIHWSTCDDRAYLGSRLMLAGLKRMGVKT